MKEVDRKDLFKDFSKKEIVNAIVNCIDSSDQMPLLKYLKDNNERHKQRVINRILKDIENSKKNISAMEEYRLSLIDKLQTKYRLDSLALTKEITRGELIDKLNSLHQLEYALINEKNILINLEQQLKDKEKEPKDDK